MANDAGGWGELIALLNTAEVDLVVVEATGGYERGAVCAMQEAQPAVARVNPRHARNSTKSMGVLAKTDQVDARRLRDFADVLARHKDRGRFITPLMHLAGQLMDLRVAENSNAGRRGNVGCLSTYQCLDLGLTLETDLTLRSSEPPPAWHLVRKALRHKISVAG